MVSKMGGVDRASRNAAIYSKMLMIGQLRYRPTMFRDHSFINEGGGGGVHTVEGGQVKFYPYVHVKTKVLRPIALSISKEGLKNNTEIYVIGDFNIDLKDKAAPSTKELPFTTGINSLLPMIHKITRFSCREGVVRETCIDNIFTNSELITEAKTQDLKISDYLAVFVRRKKARLVHKAISFTGRSYWNVIKGDFQRTVLDSDWEDFYSSRDPNTCWEIMENIIRA